MEERLRKWQEAGLITAEQAEAISEYEAVTERRRVSAREILVYIGGFFVLMAVAFGLQVKWDDLGSLSRMIVVAVPTLILWATGEALRRRGGPLLRRGAQALWMVASWLTAILIAVILIEWPGVEPKEEWLLLWASLGAVPLAAIALWVLPGLPQGLAVVTLASGVAMGGAMVAHLTWPEMQWAEYVPLVVVGAGGLAAAEVARRREKGSLIWLFNLFGAWSWLLGALFIAGQVSWRANIYVMDADGSNQTRLTRQAAGDWSPGWSPDGSRIAFESVRDGIMDIYVMDADGSNQARLTRHAAGASSAAWSPDGNRIAFESGRAWRPSLLVWDVLLLTECLMFIGWSVGRQSRVLLYSGLFFLFVGIVQINSHFFRGQLGLPVALLIAGIALIAIGLGVHRLRRRDART